MLAGLTQILAPLFIIHCLCLLGFEVVMSSSSAENTATVETKSNWHIDGQLLFEIFCALVFLGMVGLVFYNAFLRYFFRSSFPPSEEWARFLFIYIIYYGAIEACIRKKHIAVDLLLNQLYGCTRRFVVLLADVLSLVALVLLTAGGINIVMLTYDIGSVATDVNMALINSCLPIMSTVAFFITLKDTFDHWKAPLRVREAKEEI